MCADVQALPFRDAAFDAIKVTELLEHVPVRAAALAECRRVLRPGGHLVSRRRSWSACTAIPTTTPLHRRSMWRRLLAEVDLKPVDTVDAQGGYFTHLAGMLASWCSARRARCAGPATALFPLLDLLARLDASPAGARATSGGLYVGGYLIVAERPPAS